MSQSESDSDVESYETVRDANVSVTERDEQGFLIESPSKQKVISRAERIRRDRNVSRRQRTQARYDARISRVDENEDGDNDDTFVDSSQARPPPPPVQPANNVQSVRDSDEMAAPKLIGASTLPELNVKAVDMAYKLQRVFDKFENLFKINRLTNSADDEKLKAGLVRQYIGDAALAAIHPTGRDRTKTYEELKAAIQKKFQPVYNELMLRAQFVRCTMSKNQTSRDFLQTLWEAICRTSCKDEEEQLHWVLMCYVTRHSNTELRRSFELRPPKTEDEALQITDDIESKQRDRGANEKINAALKDAGPVEVNAVDQRKRGNGQRGGMTRGGGRGGFGNRPSNTGDCRACGGTAKCQAGRCPAVGATCYECFKTGHLVRVCNQQKARQAAESTQRQQGGGRGGGGGFGRPRGVNECDVAGAGYAERQEHRQFNSASGDHGSASQYAEQNAVGYFPVYQAVDEQSTYASVQANQMAFLQDLTRRANSTPTAQRTPKASMGQTVQDGGVQFEQTALDEVSQTLFQSKETCAHDVWVETATMNQRRVQVKIDTGAHVNVMSRHHYLELGYCMETLKQSNVILVLFNQTLVWPLGCAYIETELRGKKLPMLFHVVPTCANVLVC